MTRMLHAVGTAGTTGTSESVRDRLLEERIVFLGQPVDDDVANRITSELLLLAAHDPTREITFYINSPGGSVTAGMAIYDTMQLIRPEVSTWALGFAASMGQFLLSAGAPGKRYALPNARILIHQPHGGAQGQSTDMELAVAEMVEMRRRMVDILVGATGQPAERIVADIDRDYIVRGEDAVAYGLVDHVIERRQLPGTVPIAPIAATTAA